MTKILAVEDHTGSLSALTGHLKHFFPQCVLLSAPSGKECIEAAREMEPDIVLLDIRESAMEGHDLCALIKGDPALMHIPVLLIADGGEPSCGADAYLRSSFLPHELVAQVRILLRIVAAEKRLRKDRDDLGALIDQRTAELRKANAMLEREISERKEIEKELIIARDRAESASNLKSNFLANMSHEFRTPLHGILGLTEFLYEDLENDSHRQVLRLVIAAGKRLFRTLDLLIKMSQITAGEYTLYKKPFLCQQLAEIVARKFQDAAAAKKLPLHLDIASDSEIISDEEVLMTIMCNLVDNAIKFTEKGEIRIILDRRITNGRPCVIIEVKDTGIGITKEHIDILFQEFRQASEGTARSHEGCGLGLALSKKMTEMLGGTLTMTTEKGIGSTFTVSIPTNWDSETIPSVLFDTPSPAVPAPEELGPHALPSALPPVLIVEDSFINAQVMITYLEKSYTVDHAPDSSSALSMASKKPYRALFIDVNLGMGADGIHLLKELRKMPAYRQVPIAAVTGYALSGDRQRLLNEGFDHYLSKPFTEKELMALMKELFSTDQTSAAPRS